MTQARPATVAALIALIGLAALDATPCQALGGWQWGLRVGVGRSRFTGQLGDSLHRAKLGICLGTYGTFEFGRTLALQPELLYVSKGANFDVSLNDPSLGNFGTLDESLDITYLEIPILLHARFPSRGSVQPHFLAGTAVDIKLDSRFRHGRFVGQEGVDPALVHDRDLSVIVGAGLAWRTPAGPVSFELRFTAGTTDVLRGSGTPRGRNNTWTITVGIPLMERPARTTRSPWVSQPAAQPSWDCASPSGW